MTDYIVSEEVAEQDFQRILKFAKVNMKADGEARKLFDGVKQEIIEDIMQGHITVEESGRPTVVTADESFTFKRNFTGKDYLLEDKHKSSDDFVCIFEQIGVLCEKSAEYINKLSRNEVDRLRAVYTVFRWF